MIQTPPAAPAPPAVPAPPGAAPQVAIPGVNEGMPQALPQTAAEIQRLRAKGRELSNQLNSAVGRREDVARELRRASDDARPGLEARLKVLDDRIVSLEREIEVNSRMIANSPLELVGRTENNPIVRAGGPNPELVVPIVGMISVFGVFPIAIAIARSIWKGRGARGPSPRDLQQDERLARMEQAIDAMAIELERVTEGQRFVTRLLTEQSGAGAPAAPILGAGRPAAAPVEAQRAGARPEAR